MEEILPGFRVYLQNSSSENGIFLTFQNCDILSFHISVFVNTTAMVVSYITKLGPVDVSSDVTPR